MNNTKFGSERILFEDNHLIIVNKNPGELYKGQNWRSYFSRHRKIIILKINIKNLEMYI